MHNEETVVVAEVVPSVGMAPYSPAELAKARGFRASPAAVYLSSLTTDKSRKTAKESLHRITSILGYKGKTDWIHFPWERLTINETMFVRARLIETMGPGTVRLTLTMLRMVLHTAYTLEYLTHEQWARATTWPRFSGKSVDRGRALTAEELGKLREYLDELPGAYGEMMVAIFAVGVGAGLRREEISRLKVDSLRDDSMLVVKGKGRKERLVSMMDGIEEDVRRWLTTRAERGFKADTMFVSLGADGRNYDCPITPEGLAKRVRTIFCRLGFKGVSTHDLRRTYATRLLEEEPDITTVQRLMGHESQLTTGRYDKRGIAAGVKLTAQVRGWGKNRSEPEVG